MSSSNIPGSEEQGTVPKRTRLKTIGVGRLCVAKNCIDSSPINRKSGGKTGLHFFNFPNEEERCKLWVLQTGNPELTDRSLEDLAKNFAICSDHFEDEMFVNSKQKQRLFPNAIPTIFGETEESTEEVTKGKPSTKKRKNTQRNPSERPKRFCVAAVRKSPLTCHALRLRPGEDLKVALKSYANKHNLQGAFILSCVGSLEEAELRLADSKTIIQLDKPHEILSLSGTVSGGGHLHISLSDKEGKVVGGHLGGKAIIHTTAEIVLGELPELSFTRSMDERTNYKELVVQEREVVDSEEQEILEDGRKNRRKNTKKSNVKLISNENGIPIVSVNDTLLSISHA